MNIKYNWRYVSDAGDVIRKLVSYIPSHIIFIVLNDVLSNITVNLNMLGASLYKTVLTWFLPEFLPIEVDPVSLHAVEHVLRPVAVVDGGVVVVAGRAREEVVAAAGTLVEGVALHLVGVLAVVVGAVEGPAH